MAKRTCQHEKMKDRMIEFKFIDTVKNGANGIRNSAGNQPNQSVEIEFFHQTSKTEHNNPTHENIENR